MSLRYPFLFHTVLIVLLLFAIVPLPAQELTGEARVLEQDIKTSTLSELAAWCRELGLSEGGTRDTMAQRLRDYFSLHTQTQTNTETESKDKIITIESARTTEYFTLDTVNEEYARLRGDVVVSLQDGDETHRISAGEILYNRTRNIMSASEGVEYVRTKGDTIETFKGESITVELDNWSSVFLDGLTEKAMAENETTYRFAGAVISRGDEDVTVMRDAVISNGKDPEAYWSLDAAKLWLLPGSDWAVFNAVLKVGEIPVLWIPALYFPSDEVIFHPVLGTRSREGSFVQTTTYLWGRPKVSSTSESSLSRIMGSGQDMEKEQDGLFLRSTGRKAVDPNTKRLSFLFDVYSNLGAYLGSELALPASGVFGGLQVSAGLGFTRNVYNISNSYSPFAVYDGSTEWNNSYFFSNNVPFRYRLNATGSLAPSKYGSFSWTFPAYSDAYVDNDFTKNRSETMDWVKLLKGEAADETTTTTTTITTIGEYSWRLNGALTPNVSKANPYISSLGLSSISSSVLFKPRTLAGASTSVSPERTFFFPDKFTIFSISGSIAGTPLTLGSAIQTVGKAEEAKEDARFTGIHAPWETPPTNDSTAPTTAAMTDLSPPTLAQTFTLPKSGGPLFTITYGFTPSTALEQQFRSSAANWPEISDIDWSEITSTRLRSEMSGNIGFNVTQPETGLYSNTLRFSGSSAWETYTYMNEEAEEYTTSGVTDQTKMDTAWMNAYNASFFRTYYEWNTTVKPFFQSAMWANTNFQYSAKGLFAKTVFDGTAQDPSWDIKMGEWVKEDLDTNSVSANLAASVMDHVQSLTVSSILPPKDSQLSANATMRIWRTETNLREDITEPFNEDKRILKPVYFTETIKLGSNNTFTFQQQFTYDPELEEYTSVTSTFSGAGFSASFAALRSKGYIFDAGWIQSTDAEKLNPSSLRFAYTKTISKKELWDKQLTFSTGFNTALSFDLQRYTYSTFTFGFNATLGITRFLDISIATSSENREMYRYFHGLKLPFFSLPVDPSAEKENNFFLDMLNSFRFDDDDLRRRSGFKLKTFTLKLLHHLGDWDATLSMTLSPYMDATSRSYKFNNEVSFLVQWKPVTEIKSELYHNKEVWSIK